MYTRFETGKHSILYLLSIILRHFNYIMEQSVNLSEIADYNKRS